MGLVSRVTPVHTAVRNCTRDGGRSFEVGNQVLISRQRIGARRPQIVAVYQCVTVRCFLAKAARKRLVPSTTNFSEARHKPQDAPARRTPYHAGHRRIAHRQARAAGAGAIST
jgi:hypothetical protein